MLDAAVMQSESAGDMIPVRGLDRRTSAAKRVRSLIMTFSARIGVPLDAVQGEMVRRAAELTVAAESARRTALRGEAVDISQVIKLENLAARAVRALNLGNPPSASGPTLSEYLASKATEAA